MRMFDVEMSILESGAVCLSTDLYGRDESICLHPGQLRLIWEELGYVPPPPLPDEQAKYLARQICEVLLEICDQSGLSPKVDSAIDRLIWIKDSLPRHLFPDDLYEDDAQAANSTPVFALQAQEGGKP